MIRFALLVAAATVAACAPEDAGRLVVDGYEVEPAVLPVVLVGDGVVGDDELEAAAQWWEARACWGLFEVEPDRWLFEDFALTEPRRRPVGYAVVMETELPATHGDALGLTSLLIRYGQIDAADVLCSPDATGELRARVIRHELGHLLGLADDPPSVDLDSVMSDRPGGRLTPGDRALICY